MNIVPRYISRSKFHPAHAKSGHTLYVTINCELPKRYTAASISINNDVNHQDKCSAANFHFEPKFGRTYRGSQHKQIVFPIETLPSRISPEIIAEAAAQSDRFKTDGKPLIAIMIKDAFPIQLHDTARIAQALTAKHDARIAICVSPGLMNYQLCKIQDVFRRVPDELKCFWGQKPNPYLALLGAATHFVTSGTLSTTCDLLATGKPVYYTNDGTSDIGCDMRFRDSLLQNKIVQPFSTDILDTAPPDAACRALYAEEWKRVGAEFADALAQHLRTRGSAQKSRRTARNRRYEAAFG